MNLASKPKRKRAAVCITHINSRQVPPPFLKGVEMTKGKSRFPAGWTADNPLDCAPPYYVHGESGRWFVRLSADDTILKECPTDEEAVALAQAMNSDAEDFANRY